MRGSLFFTLLRGVVRGRYLEVKRGAGRLRGVTINVRVRAFPGRCVVLVFILGRGVLKRLLWEALVDQ